MRFDDISVLLLRELQANARQSYRELAAKVGLTAPAVAERVRRMERAGIIRGYHADVDPKAVGRPLLAIIRLTSTERREQDVDEHVAGLEAVIECHRVTGAESHIMVAVVADTDELEDLLEEFWPFGPTVTHIVTSSPVPRRPIPVTPRQT